MRQKDTSHLVICKVGHTVLSSRPRPTVAGMKLSLQAKTDGQAGSR